MFKRLVTLMALLAIFAAAGAGALAWWVNQPLSLAYSTVEFTLDKSNSRQIRRPASRRSWRANPAQFVATVVSRLRRCPQNQSGQLRAGSGRHAAQLAEKAGQWRPSLQNRDFGGRLDVLSTASKRSQKQSILGKKHAG